EAQVAERSLFPYLALGRVARCLVGLHQALGEVPVAVGAQHQAAPAVGKAAYHHHARGQRGQQLVRDLDIARHSFLLAAPGSSGRSRRPAKAVPTAYKIGAPHGWLRILLPAEPLRTEDP